MGKVRVNDLARELEVYSREILDCLPRLGVTDKKSHSSALDDEIAEKVRAYFSGVAKHQEIAAQQQPSYPIGRSIAEIKQAPRKAAPPSKTGPVTVSSPPVTSPPARTNGDSTIDWTVELGRLKRLLSELLSELDDDPIKREEFSRRITRLCFQQEKLPARVARLMQAVGEFRNDAEHEGYSPASTEAAAVLAIWAALTEWAEKNRLTLAARMKNWKPRPENS